MIGVLSRFPYLHYILELTDTIAAKFKIGYNFYYQIELDY